jgi:hypothetical protein
MRGLDPEKTYLDHEDLDALLEAGFQEDLEPALDPGPETLDGPSPPSAAPPAATGPAAVTEPAGPPDPAPGTAAPPGALDLERRLAALADRLEAALAPPGDGLVDALERLFALHREGLLTDGERDLAKARILGLAEPPGPSRRVDRGRHRSTLCVDFDGVLHSYESGWRGALAIPDPPVAGAIEWLVAAAERYDLAITSARSAHPGAVEAMKAWLRRHGLPERVLERISFPLTKPPAELYLDDRALRFEGTFPSLDSLTGLTPWTHAP